MDLGEESPEVHAGIGGYYSHVTAPLRRLIDRYATEVCLAVCAGTEVPAWVREGASEVLQTMARTSQTANAVNKAALHLTEATVLAPWVGQNFPGVVLKRGEDVEANARIFVTHPPVLAPSIGAPAEGDEAMFSLVKANPNAREVVFAWPAD